MKVYVSQSVIIKYHSQKYVDGTENKYNSVLSFVPVDFPQARNERE